MGIVLLILIIASICIVIGVVFGLTLLVGYKTSRRYLQILLGIYTLTFFCLSVIMYYQNHVINSMNSVSTKLVNNNVAYLTLKPVARGEYGIYIELENESLISEIANCNSLEINNITKEKNVDLTKLKKCYYDFGDTHISTTINGKSEPPSLELILAFIKNEALLRSFHVEKDNTYQISIVINKNMKKILDANPVLSVKPTEINQFIWKLYFFSFYLPFGVAVFMSFIFYRNRFRA